jgi:NTP pyrophosphatase (non-canonical NTP hydrolase)
MDDLREGASLGHIQQYVAQLEIERGFADQSAIQKCLLLGEEVGELFKAVRKHEGMPIEQSDATLSIAGELADMIIYLCAIANRYEISLEDAFRDKERQNATRIWAPATRS